MNRFFLYTMLFSFAAVICEAGVSARREIKLPDGKEIVVVNGKVGYGDINGEMRRIEEDIENLERKMRKVDPDSKKGISMENERELLSLKFIHEAQKFILDGGLKNKDKRSTKVVLMMKNETEFLQKSLQKSKDFPYLEYLGDAEMMLKDIRSGKIKYSKKMPKRDTILLLDIQKLQLEALDKIHKDRLRNRNK